MVGSNILCLEIRRIMVDAFLWFFLTVNHDEVAVDHRLSMSLPSTQWGFVEDRKSESSDLQSSMGFNGI